MHSPVPLAHCISCSLQLKQVEKRIRSSNSSYAIRWCIYVNRCATKQLHEYSNVVFHIRHSFLDSPALDSSHIENIFKGVYYSCISKLLSLLGMQNCTKRSHNNNNRYEQRKKIERKNALMN